MSIRVIKAGISDSIQDLGRYGHQHWGINPTGAMDKFSATIANILIGNDPGEATIEMHFPCSVFLFEKPALIAIAGGNFSATINGEPVPLLQAIMVNKNTVLQFNQFQNGARVYFAVKGGFEITQWMNSYSTHLKAGVGGLNGRSLRKDDQLFFKKEKAFSFLPGEKEFMILPWKADNKWKETDKEELLVLPGNEWKYLTDDSQQSFTKKSFGITNQSDRMGYRLNGTSLKVSSHEELVSSAVNFGTIQLLPDGQLILLMADHQTTGGYPRIAHVISAHHSKAAQMRSGDKIFFRFTDQQTAEDLLIKQQQHLSQLKSACQFKLQSFLND